MKFTAAGDMIIQKKIYAEYEGFQELTPFIMQGDARFFNLETTLNHEGETFASQFSGGTYLRTNPEILEDIKPFGFNMTSFNNNHVLDFSYDGLISTLEAVQKSGLVHSGVGRNLDEAAAPRYLETPNGRVALIALNTSFEPSMMAGTQSPRIPGRPGINGLRTESYVKLPPEDIAVIKRIARETHINAEMDVEREGGYMPPLAEDQAELGNLHFVAGDTPQYITKLNETDMARVEKAIYEAQLQADYILISVHSHQVGGESQEYPPTFLQEFAHRCIDAGAHAIIGHGPHLLRPIEVYKDCPIFYSLGDFVLQLYNVPLAPADFYAKYGLNPDETVHTLLKTRSRDFTIGLMEDVRMFRAVIPYWETEGTRLTKLTLLPIEMVMRGHKSEIGLPRRSDNPEICSYLSEMCKPFGTRIVREPNGLLTCTW